MIVGAAKTTRFPKKEPKSSRDDSRTAMQRWASAFPLVCPEKIGTFWRFWGIRWKKETKSKEILTKFRMLIRRKVLVVARLSFTLCFCYFLPRRGNGGSANNKLRKLTGTTWQLWGWNFYPKPHQLKPSDIKANVWQMLTACHCVLFKKGPNILIHDDLSFGNQTNERDKPSRERARNGIREALR